MTMYCVRACTVKRQFRPWWTSACSAVASTITPPKPANSAAFERKRRVSDTHTHGTVA